MKIELNLLYYRKFCFHILSNKHGICKIIHYYLHVPNANPIHKNHNKPLAIPVIADIVASVSPPELIRPCISACPKKLVDAVCESVVWGNHGLNFTMKSLNSKIPINHTIKKPIQNITIINDQSTLTNMYFR